MNRSILGIALITLSFTGAAMAAPLILPQSAVGTNKTVVISNHPYNLNGGGLYTGTVAGNGAWLWCVDIDNGANTSGYQGNVTLLDNTWSGGQNSLVQKGTSATTFAQNTFSAIGIGTFTPNNEQRYQMTFFTSGGTNSGNAAGDQAYQNALWRLLDAGGANISLSAAENGFLVTALKAVITTNPSYGYGTWAVVSGPLPVGGATQYQTFLAQVQPGGQIPEPGTYALMGAGLVGLAFLRRRKG
jgi:hypothetical protein